MKLELVNHDAEILHTKLKDFDFKGDIDPVELTDSMFEIMKNNSGLGLSANQVGINARVFVMGLLETRIDVFNPQILNYIGSDGMLDEGCLSYPGIFMRMKRPSSIHVKFQDKTGKFKEEVFYGMTARVFLHEYDHLEGITFKDRVSKMKWDLATRRMVKNLKRKIRNDNTLGTTYSYS